mgnify:CR=1 FL=1
MRLIIMLILLLVLNTLHLSQVNAKPSILINPDNGQIHVNGVQNPQAETKINTELKGVRLVAGAAVKEETNNVSLLSITVPTEQGEQAFTFDITTGKKLRFEEIVYPVKFEELMGFEAKEIKNFVVRDGEFFVQKADQYQSMPFEGLLEAIDINKMSGCFNILNINEKADGLSLKAKVKDLIVVILPSDKIRGGAWQQHTVKSLSAPVAEINRSYFMGQPNNQDSTGYDIFVFAVQKAESYKLQMEYTLPTDLKAKKNFTLYIQGS